MVTLADVSRATRELVRKHKGIHYYADYRAARSVRDSLLNRHPEARVVDYQRGWAVQYRRSGPYYPE